MILITIDLACHCNGHSKSCTYNATIDALGLSKDIHGRYEGGGVCHDCQVTLVYYVQFYPNNEKKNII
jgi:hypothetical protein